MVKTGERSLTMKNKNKKDPYPEYDGFFMKINTIKEQIDDFYKCHYIEVYDKQKASVGQGKIINLWNLKGQTAPFKKTHYLAFASYYGGKVGLASIWDIEHEKDPVGYNDQVLLMTINNVQNKVYWDDDLSQYNKQVENPNKPPEWFNKFNKEIISPALLEVRTKQEADHVKIDALSSRLTILESKCNAEFNKNKGGTL